MATLIQMTYPGAPCVYYGDEIAIRGSAEFDQPFMDPDARWAFPWQDKALWDLDMFSYFKDLIHLRRSNPVLRNGRFTPILGGESLIVYSRSLAQESNLIAVNSGREEALFSLPAYRQETEENPFGLNRDPHLLFGAATMEFKDSRELQITLPARSGIVVR
jgi:glycosidase